MLIDFKNFVMRGNVLDMAVGIVIGAAFGKIVSSLVQDVIMPPIGMALGAVDFSNLFFTLNGAAYPSLDAAKKAGAPVIAYGSFVNTIIDFLIVALAMFLIIQWFQRIEKRFQKPAAPEPPKTQSCPECLSAIPAGAKRCPQCTVQLRQAA